jgi:hypothetical protein
MASELELRRLASLLSAEQDLFCPGTVASALAENPEAATVDLLSGLGVRREVPAIEVD